MAKKDISTILTKGTAKQKLSLVAEYIARSHYYHTGKDELLTDAEFNKISESFKTPGEIKLWNKFNKIDKGVSWALNNLQGTLFELKMHYSNLRGYILVWNTIEASELITNSILHQIEPTERKRITNKLKGDLNLLFTKVEPDEEGYLDYKIDFERESYLDENGKPIGFKEEPKMTKQFTLLYAMNNIRKDTEKSISKFLSWTKAVEDFMKENDFNPETYKNIIKEYRTEALKDIIGWRKYLSNYESFDIESPFLDKHKFRYNVTPDFENIEVNEEDYNWFKSELMR